MEVTNLKHFSSSAEFRSWLTANHDQVKELWIGFFKKNSGRTGLSYREAVDEALCFGWIDGQVKGLDAMSYAQRFTPRKSRSTWSRINLERVKVLQREGRMAEPGKRALAARDPRRTGIYSFENAPRKLDAPMTRKFRANNNAWTFFQAQPEGYRRLMCWWIMSGKQLATRERRLARLICASAKGVRIR